MKMHFDFDWISSIQVKVKSSELIMMMMIGFIYVRYESADEKSEKFVEKKNAEKCTIFICFAFDRLTKTGLN